MKKYIGLLFAAVVLLSSCVDTIILPNNKTVKEDFWKTKSDVALMVNGAYASMLSSTVIQRLIVWGDFRSDELVYDNSVQASNSTRIALAQIETGNIETTNTFSDWSSFYYVINNCNLVLDNAAAVMEIDPSYTEGDYLSDRAQMLTLRSLCYFYLVRAFRDVPYSAQAFENSSQELNLPQTAPDVVLQNCINDLKEAEQNAVSPDAYSGWKRTGWINRDAVRSLLADIYLWRASVMHNDSDYQRCIDYCDLVIESRKSLHVVGAGEVDESEYPLAEYADAFNDLFVEQNAEESIFELQFDGSNNSNTGLCQSLYKYTSSSTNGFMVASSIFGQLGENNVYEKSGDARFIQNCYGVVSNGGSASTSYSVRKMVTSEQTTLGNPVSRDPYKKTTTRAYNSFRQNYIVYRLSDIMLMKAEAMTQLATGDDDIQLRQAFNLVQYVNNRSIYTGSLSNDSLRWTNNNSKTSMETLVLKERLRELCFEGKRWYDLLRYNYRHVEGVDYTKTLGQQGIEGSSFVRNYTEMMNLMARKNSSSSASLIAKMRTEPYLYMPVLESQMKLNPQLVQNPVYESSNEFVKQ